MEFIRAKLIGIKEKSQKKLNEIIEDSGDGPGTSYGRFTLMEKICVR
jgi:hypothetical protein